MPVNYAGTASDQRTVLLSSAAATGAWQPVTGGLYTFAAWGGTWGGATAQLQWSDTSGLLTAFDVEGATLSADGSWANVPLATGYARCAVIGGAGVVLNATLSGISN
jgi:hypothetical protein